MAAKTQDAAGVLVRGTLRVSFHPEDYADRRWVATRTDNTNIWAESLYLLANHLNLDVEEFNRCAALMEPATPRETAIAAPTGETVPGLWDVMVSMALKPRQVCVSATDEAQVAALLAARVPTPIAEPEIMALARRVIEAWESPDLSVRDFDKSLTVLRDALAEFDHYSTGGRDASE